MAHLLADDAGMTVDIGCPDQIRDEDGRLVWPTFTMGCSAGTKRRTEQVAPQADRLAGRLR